MANTFELISSVTVGAGGAASIDFTSIPATFTDLCLKVSSRDNNTGSYWSNIWLRFNGSTSSYSSRLLYDADGTAGSTSNATNALTFAYSTAPNATANTFGNTEFYIPNYAGSAYKSVSSDSVTENNGTNILLGMQAGLWSNTAAVNQITLIPANSASFVQYSTAYLYGVSKS